MCQCQCFNLRFQLRRQPKRHVLGFFIHFHVRTKKPSAYSARGLVG
jgi:hypothetical protein